MQRWSWAVLFASSVVMLGCGATSESPVYIDDEVRSPTTTALIVPLTTLAPENASLDDLEI